MENTRYILVTGGAGYIGSHAVVELINSGFVPVILDDFRNSQKFIIDNLREITGKEILVIEAACQDESQLRQAFEQYRFHGVIHFAADKAVGESVQDPLKYYDNNLNSLISILRAMEQFKTRNFVFSSSCSVYGNPKNENNEVAVFETAQSLLPESPYGNTKLISEQMIRQWSAVNPVCRAALLRYFNPIGAHRSGLIGEFPQGIPNNLLPYITQTAFGIREKLTVFGNDYDTIDGTCVRDYIHVSDLASAHVKAIHWLENQPERKVEVFNIGTGKGTSVLEIIAAFENCTGKSLNWEFGPRRTGDVHEIYADTTKAENLLAWKSQFTIQDAIEDAWRWENKRPKDV